MVAPRVGLGSTDVSPRPVNGNSEPKPTLTAGANSLACGVTACHLTTSCRRAGLRLALGKSEGGIGQTEGDRCLSALAALASVGEAR
jgi:hypothetical protein